MTIFTRAYDGTQPVRVEQMHGNTFNGEDGAHQFVITGVPTGTVTAYMMRADGTTCTVDGTNADDTATVTLNQDCYNVPGRFTLSVFVGDTGTRVCVYACVGIVYRTRTETIIDSGDVVPSLDDIIAKQAELAQDVADASSAIASAQNAVSYLAPVFSTSRTYAVGEYVTKDGALYICTVPVETAGAWDATNWQSVTFGEEVTGLKSALNNTTGSEIVSNWTSGYYATSSSVTNVDVTSITPSARYRCTYVSCNPGDVFVYTGTGTLSARPWAFLKANGDIVGTKGASGAHTNERIIAPANSAKVVFNADAEATFLVCKGDYVITKVNNNANNINSIESRLLQTNVNIPWEIGNIAFDTTPTYKYDRSTRVRTPQGYALRLNAGDVVGMKSYTNAGFYVGWYDDNNSFHYTSAKYADYTITQNGNYIFLLRNVTEVSQGGDAYSLGNLFFVHSKANADEVYAETLEYTGRAIAQNESGLNYHLFKQAKPRFAMHRGYSTLAPENTVPAFELAGRNGAWGIETDIYETTDGHFVCFHDETVDRMTDGTGHIADMTLSQIEALTIDSGANIEQYPNLKIPTLETFLSICRRYGCVGLIEIKSVIHYDDLCELIRSKGLENGVILLIGTAIKAPILRYYTKSVIAALGYSSTVAIDLINSVCTFENMAVDFDATTINDSTGIDAAHEKNLPVIVWTTDTESRADELFRLGVDVVTTNSIPAFSMG